MMKFIKGIFSSTLSTLTRQHEHIMTGNEYKYKKELSCFLSTAMSHVQVVTKDFF